MRAGALFIRAICNPVGFPREMPRLATAAGEGAGNAAERAVKRRAYRVYGCYDYDRNSDRDDGVFNRRRSGLILAKSNK